MLRLYLAGLFPPTRLSETSQEDPFRDKCLRFNPEVGDARLEFTEFLESGAKAALTHRDPTCGGPGLSPAVSRATCRVAMYIQTSSKSGVQLEAWLPEEWNGRFLSTGNGGIGGCETTNLYYSRSCC
jgi:feruloyl esterase